MIAFKNVNFPQVRSPVYIALFLASPERRVWQACLTISIPRLFAIIKSKKDTVNAYQRKISAHTAASET